MPSSDVHRAAITALVGRFGSLSRPEIAQRLQLSPATVTQLTKDLIRQGIVRELASAPSRGGRPAQLLGLADRTKRALGVKVTPDHVAIADVELDGTVRGVSVHDFDSSAVDALGDLTDTLSAVMQELDTDSLLGIGFGVPGGVTDPVDGVVQADLLGWKGLPLGRRLRSSLGLPVLVDNDVNALAIAERLYSRGQKHRDFLIISIGIGVGAGIVTNGNVHRGAHGDAGELGHTPVDSGGPICVCGNPGCLEAVIGDRALVAAAHRDGVLGPDQDITELRAIADDGDEAAQGLFRDAGKILGRAVASLVNVLDPEMVVIFGEGASVWQHWQPGFDPTLRTHLPPTRRHIPVEIDSWDDEAWTRGAAALVLGSPFDTTGTTGEQGRLVRARLTATTARGTSSNGAQL